MVWRRFLNSFSSYHGYLHSHPGSWLQPASKLQRAWPYLYSPSGDTLYVRSGLQYQIHSRVRTRIYSYGMTHAVSIPPDDGIPIDCTEIFDGWRIPGFPASLLPSPSVPLSSTFDDFLDQQPEHVAALLPRINWYCDDIYDFCRQATDLSKILLVCDGGAADNMGTFGWIIGTSSGTRLASGSGPVFGFDPRSYRSETYGCRSGLSFIKLAFSFCNLPMTGTLSVRCDNLGLIKKQASFRKFALAKYSAALHSKWDALISVFHLMNDFPAVPKLTHVLGHQDNDLAYQDLPLAAQMNTQADALATMELDEYATPFHHVPFNPESRVMLSINGTAVTRRLETTIRTHARLPSLILYYKDRLNWDDRTFHAVDWDVFGGVYSKMRKRRNFITKFCTYHLPTGDRLHQRDPKYDDRCPTCHSPTETDDHILQCPSPARRAWRSDLIKTLLDPLSSFLDPVLLDILREGLLQFFRASCIDPTDYSQRYQPLLTQQKVIGWNNLLRGKFSEEWRYLQEQHCHRHHIKMTNSQ